MVFIEELVMLHISFQFGEIFVHNRKKGIQVQSQNNQEDSILNKCQLVCFSNQFQHLCSIQYIIVMPYLNSQSSFSHDYTDGLNESFESQTQFLKQKLVETHSKLIKELGTSKKFEEMHEEAQLKYDQLLKSYEDLNRKYTKMNYKSQKQKNMIEVNRQLEISLMQYEKKNDLMRVDLESMRNKILEAISAKNQLEEKTISLENNNNKMSQKQVLFSRQLKISQVENEELKQQLQRFRSKYQRQVKNNNEIEQQLKQTRNENIELGKRYEQTEIILRQQKDKNNKISNELIIQQRQAHQLKLKYDSASNEKIIYRDQLSKIKSRNSSEERHLSDKVTKLTYEYNNLQSMYKNKEKELEMSQRKPVQSATKKKAKLEQVKILAEQLQKEENSKRLNSKSKEKHMGGSYYTPKTPNTKKYREEKEEYLSMIQSVSSMENGMLNCNMERKRIVAEMDRIDQARVKTKDMISKRRKLEAELLGQQKKLEHFKNQLKKMKVM